MSSSKVSARERALKVGEEVLLMREQYLKNIKELGIGMARQMSFLVENGSHSVISGVHRTAIEELTAKIEIEAAKVLTKASIEASGGKKKKKKRGGRAADEIDEKSE